MVLSDLALIGVVSISAALLGLFIVYRDRARPVAQTSGMTEPLTLLFDGGVLHHATQNALSQFALYPGQSLWEDLCATLRDRFPEMPEQANNGDAGSMTMHAYQNGVPSSLEMRWRGPLCWVTLTEDDTQNMVMDPVLLGELEALRQSCRTSPNAIWHQDENDTVIWHNQPYAALKKEYGRTDNTPLFTLPNGTGPHRISLKKSMLDHVNWFEVSCVHHNKVRILHASSIDALVEAEIAQRNFVQTLAKTFAHLSIGLAIFDRNAQLALFNPALIDLTGLPAPFLSGRPNMLSFFDLLRENRQMPEPKNYLTWRQEIAEVIAAAHDGKYQETWSLENGRTYSVLGRPHPDGATAFLFEDISSEVALTRNFRTEQELGQALLDTVSDGIVAFSSAGILNFTNDAYREIWGQNPEFAFADVTIHDCIALWQQSTTGTVPWQAIEHAVMDTDTTEGLEVRLALNDGRILSCEVMRLLPDATALRFRVAAQTTTPAKRPRKTKP